MSEVATAWVSLLPSTRGFGARLSSQAGPEVDSAGKGMGLGFGKVFAAAAVIGIGGKVAGFIGDSIGAASDLQETMSKNKVVFGQVADEVERFADKGPQALGQTKTAALDAAATFGTFGKAAGLSGKDLAGFSTDLVGLSADLASFHNATPEEAVVALGAALRGESEPIRRFGVLLDDASLRNEALRLGLVKTTKDALTPQNKTLAAQSLIMKQTKDAQGDFARTSDGLANSQRILSAEFGNLKTSIGSAFLPVAEKVVHWAISAVQGLQGLGPVFGQVKAFIAGAFGGETGAQVSGFFQTLRDAAAQILPVMANTFQNVILPALISFATYVGTSLWPVFQQIVGIVRDQVIPIVVSLATFFYGTLYPAVLQIVAAVAKNLKPVFDALVQTFQQDVLPTVSDLLTKFEEWRPTIQKVITIVVAITGKILEFAAAILAEVLPVAIRFAGWLISTLVPAISTVIGWIVSIVAKVISFGGAVGDAAGDVVDFAGKVKDKIGDVIGFFEDLPGKVKGVFGGAAGWLVDAGQDVIRGLLKGLDTAKQWVVDKIQEIADVIPGWVKKRLGIASPAKTMIPLGKYAVDGLTEGLKRGQKKLEEQTKKMVDRLKAKMGDLKGQRDSLASSVASAFSVDLFSGTAADLIANGNASVNNLKAVTEAFGKLQETKGLSKQFLSSLYASGNSALILELANGPTETLQEANDLFDKQAKLAETLGSEVASNEFGNRIDGVRDEIANLRADLKNHPKDTADRIAEALDRFASAKQRKKK